MKEAVIVFPHQLFETHPCLAKDRKVFLVEEKRYFTDFNFHKKKLVLHRASMKAYYEFLDKAGYDVTYIEFKEDWKTKVKDQKLFAVRPYDNKLENELNEMSLQGSPAFLGAELKKAKKYLMGNFYKRQRKSLNVLMEDGKPAGGKWSFDSENRKKLPKDLVPPKITTYENKHIEEAKDYVNKNFADNPGQTDDFIYPVTFSDARKWLDQFIEERLEFFGAYEDAISKNHDFIYHSLISPLLNIGLLTPEEIVDAVLKADVPINSKEGFIRQVIGWREFILQIYLLEGENQRKSNYFGNKDRLPRSFYTADNEIPPVDNVIKKVLKNAYSHHIERLMILSNYMLLKEYDPNEVYKWFMEMYIDAYDWVMVPNVYGMAQYADGGLMSTKPYISSSNYILKMSDFKKGEWCDEWDTLFWNFLLKHKDKLKTNPRMALLLKKL